MSAFEPFVSVIVPTRNEEKYIGVCLASFATQTYPKDKFELLIIDGLSSDRTLEIVHSYDGKLNLSVMSNPRVKHVFAFNYGIKESKGDYFVIVSAHSFLEKDFIRKSADTFCGIAKDQPKLAAVGGSLQMISNTSFGMLVACIFASPFSGSSSFWCSKTAHFAKTVVFGFYNKKIVQQVGCFDEDMLKGQDFELNLRLKKNGFKLFCNPEIKPCYYVRQTFWGFFHQAFDNGVAKGICVRKGYFSPIWFIPLAFIVYQAYPSREPFTVQFLGYCFSTSSCCLLDHKCVGFDYSLKEKTGIYASAIHVLDFSRCQRAGVYYGYDIQKTA
jgi:glycosyltransferase involved in cell wall biosynthesis